MSYLRLRYHIITATKHRRRWLHAKAESLVLHTWAQELEQLGGRYIIGNGAYDHIHVLCELPPTLALSEAISRLKSRSSRAAKPAEPAFAWQKGYACPTVHAHDYGCLITYIEQQKERHARSTLDPQQEWTPT